MTNNNIVSNLSTSLWDDGFTGFLEITNKGDPVDSWQVVFESDFSIAQLDNAYQVIGASIVSEQEIAGGRYRYELEPYSYNQVLDPQESVFITFHAPWLEEGNPKLSNLVFQALEDDLEPTTPPVTPPTSSGEVTRPSYNQSTGFFTLNGKVYDANGNEFIARGVNNRHVWFDSWGPTPARDAIDNIAGFGFNSNRIVWEIDHKDGSLSNDSILESIIQETIDNKMVPQVELHDFTGRDDTNDLLNRGVKWWTDRAWMWQKYEESLMINIANEFGSYAISPSAFADVYKEAIARIRNAGINNTIVIDSIKWAKDDDAIAQFGKEIYNSDPQKNVVFSIHFYCGDGESPSQIADAFDKITGQGLPMMVGEFGPSHSPCGDVREDIIMQEADEHGVGTYAWAWDDAEWALAANRNWEADSYNELTQFGKDVIFGPHGVEETSELATIFET